VIITQTKEETKDEKHGLDFKHIQDEKAISEQGLKAKSDCSIKTKKIDN